MPRQLTYLELFRIGDIVTVKTLTDADIRYEERLAIECGDKTFARLCNRALSRTTPYALQRICDARNARGAKP
jgi:hypothetical protein